MFVLDGKKPNGLGVAEFQERPALTSIEQGLLMQKISSPKRRAAECGCALVQKGAGSKTSRFVGILQKNTQLQICIDRI